jgi:hypothetical protein
MRINSSLEFLVGEQRRARAGGDLQPEDVVQPVREDAHPAA